MGRAVAQTAEIRTPRSWPESGLVDARRGYNTAVADEAQSHAQLQGVLTELRRQSAAQAVMVVYGGRAVVMAPLGPVVAVVIGAASQLGVLRLTLARYLDDLNAALRGELASGPHAGESPASDGD